MFSSLFHSQVRSYRCPSVTTNRPEDGIFSRHEGIPGFDQDVFSSCSLGIVGGGGLSGEAAEGLVRKGIGELTIFDYDIVELSNLNRQFFGKSDLGKNKAVRLVRNLSRLGFGGTKLRGVGNSFQIALERGMVPRLDGIVCGVDNNETRIFVSSYALSKKIPVVDLGVSRDGNNGRVFVQESGKACYGCAFQDVLLRQGKKEKKSCTPDPAVKDILKITAGLALYAVDSLLMQRKRNWNYREVFLAGFVGERLATIARREDCQLCSSRAGGSEANDASPKDVLPQP